METVTATDCVPHIAAERPAFERPLRIGVMLDSFDAPRWVEKILRDIASAPFLDLALVVVGRGLGTQQLFHPATSLRRTFSTCRSSSWMHLEAGRREIRRADVSTPVTPRPPMP